MARDDDDGWKRRREREQEREEEDERERLAKLEGVKPGKASTGSPGSPDDKLSDLISRADGMIEQVNNLYNMFAAGVERLAPVERRKQLEQVMLSAQMISKPTQAALFKYSNILSKYQTHKDRWDKLL